MTEIIVSFKGSERHLASTIGYLRAASGVIGLRDLSVEPLVDHAIYVPRPELVDFIDEASEDPLSGMGDRVARALSRNFNGSRQKESFGHVPAMPDGNEPVIGECSKTHYHRGYLSFAVESHHVIDGLGAKGVGFLSLFLGTNQA